MLFELGLKEQNVVCESLGRGLQVLVPRKGGIDDEDALQIPDRPFLLLPARFHEDLDNIRPEFREPLADELPTKFDGQFQARYGARVEREVYLDEPSRLPGIATQQAFVDSILEERFHYRRPGLYLLVLRVFRLSDAVFIPDDERTAGCRSWVELPESHACEARPVLSDQQFASRVAAFEPELHG